jgi:formylglycine-generating enzyme required for sulfatase activity
VVHIAYEDGVAYARWAGKRLPAEAEWEFCRAGGSRVSRSLGLTNSDPMEGGWRTRTREHFPVNDAGEDGHVEIAPVAQDPPNGYGLYDMAGNVWQWTSDWYRHSTPPSQQEKVHRGIFSLHKSILLEIHCGYARQREGNHWDQSLVFVVCANCTQLPKRDSIRIGGG